LYIRFTKKTNMTDLDIAQKVEMQHINNIADKLDIDQKDLEQYGKYKAKLPLNLIDEDKIAKGNLILVTALTPTPAGEGKTTVSIGLNEGLNKIGKKSVVVLREPSLGPVFGIKGGAAGGGHSQVVPMEDINLHFTGDFAAIEKANNLLSALIDNNIQSKTRSLGIDPRTIIWKRVIDMNDRALRDITIGLGGTGNGIPRQDGFNITAASEVMAILCMAKDIDDLKEKLGNIFVGYTFDRKPVYARDLNAENAMTRAEKFLDIKCGYAGLKPKAVVIVATIRALRHHGGSPKEEYNDANLDRVKAGFANLEKHIENMGKFGLQRVVAINNFYTDSQEEIDWLIEKCASIGVKAVLSKGWAEGGEGTSDLARAVVEEIESGKSDFKKLYDWDAPVKDKIETIAKKIYGADGVDYAAKANAGLRTIAKLGLDHLPICMAKTQKSFSDNDKLTGRPTGFRITVREFEIAAGAGFLIPILGNMMRMPGLPAVPASEGMDIDNEGVITGLS